MMIDAIVMDRFIDILESWLAEEDVMGKLS